jgi:hypothetical protein
MKAYGVKLEELLRMGTPTALAQANDLMKIMAGYVNYTFVNLKGKKD